MILWEELDSALSRTTLRGIRFAGQVPKCRATDDDVPSAETRGKMQTYAGHVSGSNEIPIRWNNGNPSKGLYVKYLCVVLDETTRIKDRQDVLQNQLVVIQLSGAARHQNRHIGY